MKFISIFTVIGVTSAFSIDSSFRSTTRGRKSATTVTWLAKTKPGEFDYALIFDCDGVIIETEELHRLAYNAAFEAAGLKIDGEPVIWSTEYYDVLQNTGTTVFSPSFMKKEYTLKQSLSLSNLILPYHYLEKSWRWKGKNVLSLSNHHEREISDIDRLGYPSNDCRGATSPCG